MTTTMIHLTPEAVFDAVYDYIEEDPKRRFDLQFNGGWRRGVRLVQDYDDGGPLDELRAIVKGGRNRYRLPADLGDLVIRLAESGEIVWNGPALVWQAQGLSPEAAAAAAALERMGVGR